MPNPEKQQRAYSFEGHHVTGTDPYDEVLPLKDGTCVRLRDAQAVVGRMLGQAAEGQSGGLSADQAAEAMRLLDGLQKEAKPPGPDDCIRDGADGQTAFMQLLLELAHDLQRTLTVACSQCGRQLAADSGDAQVGVAADGEIAFYCADCWQREHRRGGNCSPV